MNPNVPADVVDLLRTSVTSYEGLEALLLVRRAGGTVSADDAAGALGLRRDIVASALHGLAEAGLVEEASVAGETRWGNVPEALHGVVDRLAVAYRDHRLEMVVIMNHHAVERLRSGALRAFADAFLIRRKDG